MMMSIQALDGATTVFVNPVSLCVSRLLNQRPEKHQKPT